MKISNDFILGIGVGIVLIKMLEQGKVAGIGAPCSCASGFTYFSPSHSDTRAWMPFENRHFKGIIPRITYGDTDRMIKGAL